MSLYSNMAACLTRAAAVIFLCLWSATASAAVQNMKASQQGNRVLFEYDLSGEVNEEGDVAVAVTIDNRRYDKLHVEGDVGRVKPGAGKKIWWNVLLDFPKGKSAEFHYSITDRRAVTGEADLASSAARKNDLLATMDAMNLDIRSLLDNISFDSAAEALSRNIDDVVGRSYVTEVDRSRIDKSKVYCASFYDTTSVKEVGVEQLESLKTSRPRIDSSNLAKYFDCTLGFLDPHSSFMPAETYQNMKIETKGVFSGIGIEITLKEGVLTVISPIEDTPAFRAGIKAGDQILKIDGQPTAGLSIVEAVKRLRGIKGSKVTLTVMRRGFQTSSEFEIERNTIQVKSVKYKVLDHGYAYIRISQFQEKTDDDLSKALSALQSDGKALKGLVLDLRNDPGGLLDQAVRVSERFTEEGRLIVYTEGRDKDARMRFTSRKGNKEPDYPIAVLINSGSASASEIVAGALEDHQRAVILGRKSFGKGSVQSIVPLTDGAGLRLTTARYLTPTGRSIHEKGIVPHVVLAHADSEVGSSSDPDLDFAVKFLRESEKTTGLAEKIKIAERLKGEDVAAPGILARMNVVPQPPNLSASIQFKEPSTNRMLDADEAGALVVTVKNDGNGDAFELQGAVSASSAVAGLAFDKSFLIGTVPAGGTVTRELALRGGEDLESANVSFAIELKEYNGFDAPPLKISLQTRSFEQPRLLVADLGVADANANGRIEPGEVVEVTARVQNAGLGDARGVVAEVKTGANVFLAADSASRFDLGPLRSGAFQDVKFSFYTNRRIRDNEPIPVTVALSEARARFNSGQPLALTMSAPRNPAAEIVVQGEPGPGKAQVALAGGLSVDIESGIPEGQKGGQFDVAVVIGNRSYSGSGVPDVEFALRDARLMKEYLIKTLGFQEENILYYENATFSKFRELFGSEQNHKGRLWKYVKPSQSRVFVYYNGHGAPDLDSGDAYIVPADADPHYIRENGYRLQTLYENLAQVPAKSLTVVLDACFSGNSEKGMLFRNISPAMVQVKKALAGPKGASVITSAGTDQVSAWYPEKKHSLFTYFFLKGLKGEADANRDATITVGEMGSYLKEHVPYMSRRLSGTEQDPTVTGNSAGVLAVINR